MLTDVFKVIAYIKIYIATNPRELHSPYPQAYLHQICLSQKNTKSTDSCTQTVKMIQHYNSKAKKKKSTRLNITIDV